MALEEGSLNIDTQLTVPTLNVTGALITTGASQQVSFATVTGNTTLNTTNYHVNVDATTGAIAITLPVSSGNTGRVYIIKKIDSTANTVTLTPNGVETIDGSATKVLSSQYDAYAIVSDGNNWYTENFLRILDLLTLNGLTSSTQSFATGVTGTDFGISSSGSTHTFNIPDASATARGLITTGSQTIAGTKTFSNTIVANISGSSGSVTGNASTATALQTPRTINGVSFDGTANITITASAGTLTGTTLNSTVVSSSLTSVGTIATGVWNGTAIGPTFGGTGLTSYTTGDLIQATATNTLSQLASVATGNALISGGVGTASSWGKIGLTTHISGTLAIANGGTGQTTAISAKDALTTKSTDIASAATTDLSTATGEYVNITGTTTITAFGTVSAGAERVLNFNGILTLTHNATSLILPGGANITTAANDRAILRSLGGGNWICIDYVRATSVPSTGTNTGDQTITLTSDVTGSGTGSFATTIATNAVSNSKFRQSVGLSVVGVTGSSTANVADITGTANQTLVVNNAGTSLTFGALNIASASAVTGALAIANGGTGQTSKAAGFDALSPLSTKGDLLTYTTTGIRQAVGSNGQYLIADSVQSSGIKWGNLDVDSQSAQATVASTTTSASLVDLPGATLTTAGNFTKNYMIAFTGTFSSGANNVTMSLQISINGVAQTNSLRTIRVGGTAGANFICNTGMTASVAVGQIIKIQWDTSGNTLTLQAGTISIFGVA